MRTYFVGIGLIFSLALQPLIVLGQATPNTPATNQVLSRFNPGVTTSANGNNSFGGMSFSGVGGAVLSCANIGQSVVSNVSDLFNSAEQQKKDAFDEVAQAALGVSFNDTTGEQPVTDKKALAQLKQQTQRENCLNGVAYAVAKNALQQISTNTLNWVNTGFDGNPFYVRDINSYLTSIKNQQIDNFLTTVPSSDPIFGNALRSTITQLTTGYDDGRLNQPMNTPQAIAYQNFQNDFTQGGWSAFLNPSNNPLGALFNASDKLGNTVDTAQQNVKDQLQAGNGFLDMQQCVQWAPANTDSINPLGGYTSLCSTITPANQAFCEANAGKAAAGAQQQKCIKYETVTPGSIISAQTAAITTSPIRQAEQADKINEVLGSFFEGLVNRLFSQGLGSLAGAAGLSGTITTNGTGAGNNVVLDSNGLPISTAPVSAQDAFGYQHINGGFYGEFDISRPQQLRSVIKAQMDFLNETEDAQAKMATIIPTLGELDYCYPGPNPSWGVGTNYNFQIFDAALQGKQPDKTVGSAIAQLSSFGAAFPGPGTVVAVVGNIVGNIINIASGTFPVSLTTHDLQLFDKVTNGARQIGDYNIERGLSFDDIDLLSFLERNYNAVMDEYKQKFDPTTIANAFVAANPNYNADDLRKKVGDIANEAGNLVYYNQAISQYSKDQVDNILQTKTAIQELNNINAEVEDIVQTAKARYIKEQAAAGTPVNMACINEAYNVNKDPITADSANARRESDVPDPIVQQSKDATTYFYSHL